MIQQNPLIKSSEIEKTLNLTRKQLNYTMQKVNSYLQWKNLPIIQRTKLGEFILDEETASFIPQLGKDLKHTYIFSSAERIKVSALILLRLNHVTLNHFVTILGISKNTALNSLKDLQLLCEEYQLDLKYSREFGYQIIGSEFKQRQLLSDALNDVLSLVNNEVILQQILEVELVDLNEIISQLNVIEKQLKIRFTDQVMRFLPYFIFTIFCRIKNGKIIEDSLIDNEVFSSTKEFDVAQNLVSIGKKCPSQEYLYLALLLLTSNFKFTSENSDVKNMDIYMSVFEMIEAFETVSCIKFKYKEELVDYIFQHWKAAYYRVLYNFHIENELLEAIKNRYAYLFELTKKSIYPLEKTLNKKIPDEEVGFITILYGGWLRKEKKIGEVQTSRRAIFVCENGVAISSYMYLELKDLLPQIEFIGVYSVREFNQSDITCDFIFSTVPLNSTIKTFIIKPFLSEDEKSAFVKQIQMYLAGFNLHVNEVEDYLDVIQQYAEIKDRVELKKGLSRLLYHQNEKVKSISLEVQPNLKDLLVEDHLAITDLKDWKKAISLGAKPLIDEGLIEPRYLNSMISQILISRPYIMVADGVIIAHASIDDGVNCTCMSLVKLEEKIIIHGYLQADIILVLATVNFNHHLKALSEFNDLVSNSDQLLKLRNAKNKSELLSIIEEGGDDNE